MSSQNLNNEDITDGKNDSVPGRIKCTSRQCQPCSKKNVQSTAAIFCPSCSEYQCTECSKIHKMFSFLKNHQILDATETYPTANIFDMEGLDQCDLHNELLKFFCEDESKLCCTTCALVNHRNCSKVVEIKTLAVAEREVGSKQQDIKSKAETMRTRTQTKIQQWCRQIWSLHLKIMSMQNDVNGVFVSLNRSVSKNAAEFQRETTAMIEREKSYSRSNIAGVKQSLDTIDKVCQRGTPAQQFVVEQRLRDKAKKLNMNINEYYQEFETLHISFDFDKYMKLPPAPKADHNPGRLALKYRKTNDAALNITYAHDNSFSRPKVIAVIELKKTGNDIKEPLISGLDFLADGRLIAVDNFNQKILVFSSRLEKLKSHHLTYKPQSVVAVSEEEVAITSSSGYIIDFIRVSQTNEIETVRKLTVKEQYDSICLRDDKSFIVGTVESTTPVRIVSKLGEEADLNITFGNKKYSENTSTCTYLRSSDKLVLTDRQENSVYLYDIATNTKVVVKDYQIKEPRGVAVGPSDSILVCSEDTNTIVRIAPTGHIISTYILNMMFPYKLCFSTCKSVLAVTNTRKNNKKLQLLELEV